MSYATLKEAKQSQPFGSYRKRLHYNRMRNGRWAVTLDAPADGARPTKVSNVWHL